MNSLKPAFSNHSVNSRSFPIAITFRHSKPNFPLYHLFTKRVVPKVISNRSTGCLEAKANLFTYLIQTLSPSRHKDGAQHSEGHPFFVSPKGPQCYLYAVSSQSVLNALPLGTLMYLSTTTIIAGTSNMLTFLGTYIYFPDMNDCEAIRQYMSASQTYSFELLSVPGKILPN